jgi:hypothetical protein
LERKPVVVKGGILLYCFSLLLFLEKFDDFVERIVKGLSSTSIGGNYVVKVPGENDEE